MTRLISGDVRIKEKTLVHLAWTSFLVSRAKCSGTGVHETSILQ
jgi:hypothetical protein